MAAAMAVAMAVMAVAAMAMAVAVMAMAATALGVSVMRRRRHVTSLQGCGAWVGLTARGRGAKKRRGA